MNLVALDQIAKSYADRQILSQVTVHINEGEKIGIIGVNGSGKSTLLRLVTGMEPPDRGQITRLRDLQLEYLPQQPELPEGATVLEAVLHGHSPIMGLVRDYESASRALAVEPGNATLQDSLLRLANRMDETGGWNLDSEAKTLLTRLGIQSFHQKIGELSGGQKKRVALAAALVNPANLLILDEPTNHIDPDTVEWLEQYLANFKGALLMVTHDRYFLERVTTVIFEIDRARVFRYEANYEKWLEQKAEREEREQAGELKRQNLLRRELDWIRRGAKARSTKQKARIDRYAQLASQETAQIQNPLKMSSAAARLGRKTLIMDHIGISLGGRLLIRDWSFIMRPRERLGLIGPNGCGKTTLLRLAAGLLEPDQGVRDIGSTVKIGYFAQDNDPVDPDLRVIDWIRRIAEIVHTDEGDLTAAQMLERFLFLPSQHWIPVRLLSGGERRRLYLLQILMQAPNILLLDEPTNDLDIMTLSVLEDYLEHYAGAVMVVSHDRYFLDRVVDRILAFEPDGQLRLVEGGYQAYRRQAGIRQTEESLSRTNSMPAADDKKPVARTTRAAAIRMTMGEKYEYAAIDARIGDLEKQIKDLKSQMETAASDYLALQTLSVQWEAANADYEEALSRWVYLTELANAVALPDATSLA